MKQHKRKLLSTISVTVLSVVTTSLISTSNYATAHSQHTAYAEAVTPATDKQTREEGPKIQSVSIDKHSYAPGEKVKVRVQIKSTHALTDVTVAFNNTTRVGVTSLAESATNITKQTNDMWIAEIEIAIPDKIGDTAFEFSALIVDDAEGNGDTIAPQLNPTTIDVTGLAFKVQNVVDSTTQSTPDKEPPNIFAIETDKQVYQPGDTIRASVAIKDISKLTEVSLGFVNDPDIGAPGISKFADMNKVIQHPNGHWLVPITLSIPLDSTASSYKFSHVSAIDEYGNSIGIIDDDNEISKFRDIRFAIKPLGVVQTDESLQNAPKPTQPKIEQLTIEPEQQGQKAPQQLTEPMNTEKETQDANKAKIEKSQQPVKQESQVQKTSQQATEIVDVSGALQVAKQSPNVPKFEQHIPTTKESMSETQERLLIDPMHRQSQQSGIEKRQKQFVIPPTEVVPVPSMMKQAQPMSSIKQTLFDSNQQKEDMTNNIKENKKVAKHSKLPQTGQHTYYSQIIIGGLLLIVSILLIVIVKRRLKQY